MKPLREYNLIGISGKIGSGKDTVYEVIEELSNCEYDNRKFASKLKYIAGILTETHPDKLEDQEFKKQKIGKGWGDMTYRELLQKLGTEALRNGLHDDVWIMALFSEWRPNKKWVVTDVRFPNEAQAIKDKGGILIRVERPGTATGTHASETALDNHSFDLTIENTGTLYDLYNKITALW